MSENRTGSFPPHRGEARLVRAASDAVQRSYANADRMDCPSSEAIEAVVVRRFSHPDFDDTVDHIAMCAPCLEVYNRRRQRHRFRQRSGWAAGFAALLLLGLVWTYLNREHRPEHEVAKRTPTPPVVATLDYSSWTTERSASPSAPKRETPKVARARLALTLLLPIGTEDGPYTVRVLSASGEVVAEASGVARWTGKAERLDINLDLSWLPSAAYTLTIQSSGMSERAYPVLVE